MTSKELNLEVGATIDVESDTYELYNKLCKEHGNVINEETVAMYMTRTAIDLLSSSPIIDIQREQGLKPGTEEESVWNKDIILESAIRSLKRYDYYISLLTKLSGECKDYIEKNK